jgi:hypothetical protein
MTTERVLYTDGHDVTVTDSEIRVRKQFYRLDGITRHGLAIIKPNLIPGILIVALGVIIALVGFTDFVRDSGISLELFSFTLGAKAVIVLSGLLVIAFGFIVMSAMREKYAVHIVTAEGERDVLVSKRREYIYIVVEALNKAFMNMIRQKGNNINQPINMVVSTR